MTSIRRLAGAATALALTGVGLLLGASPAQAGHNAVVVEFDPQPCTEIVFTTGWDHGEHLVDNAVLVVSVAGQVKTAPVGDPLAVGPFADPTTVHWRVFGGGERDYDDPQWTGYGTEGWGAEITKYAADNGGWDWTVAGPDDPNPYTTWHSFDVKGCATPQAPELVPAQCDALAELVIPEVNGVEYSHGSGPVNPGVVTVTADPADGYAFPKEPVVHEWEFVVDAEPGCPGEPGEDGQDGEAGGTGDSDSGDEDKGAELAQTGSPAQTAAVAGGGLLAFGLSLAGLSWLWGRRRRNALLDGLTE